MTESHAILAGDMPAVPDATLAPMFYIVSLRKFTILFLTTFGWYQLYWFYKNWDCFKDRHPYASERGTTIWPVPRALFSIFFTHALFRKIKENAPDDARVAAWRPSAHATLLVVLIVVSNVAAKVADRFVEDFWLTVFALVMVLPLMLVTRAAQAMANIACGDTQGASNATLTTANYVWMVLGCLFWLAVLAGLFMNGPDLGTGMPGELGW